ncbi:hypothetical protein HMPREF1199_00888 [Hoylesella oralis CC98A]|nr:hypothetical protein HMPREF1199_00888 [Hoylesella oralis CC98A]
MSNTYLNGISQIKFDFMKGFLLFIETILK